MPDSFCEDTPVLDTIAAMTAVSVAECELPLDALLLVRLAALAAVDTGPASYLLHIGPRGRGGGHDRGTTQNVLVAVAPIIGTARVITATIEHRRSPGIGHCGDRGRVGVVIRAARDRVPRIAGTERPELHRLGQSL